MNKIAYISGIGADKRAFDRLKIEGSFEHVYMDWIPLNSQNESFDSYCHRLIIAYDIKADDVLIGLSFGGLIAQYIAKLLGNEKVVLLSSFRNKADLQPLFHWGLKLNLYKILPSIRIPILSDLTAFFLNSWSSKSRVVIKEMLKSADFKFINWSIKQIHKIDLISTFNTGYLCLVGNNDKLVSHWTSLIPLDKGSHFMVYDLAERISEKVNSYLRET